MNESSRDHDGLDPPERGALSQKSPDAFRTISEVSVDLDVPQHVLRFWEGKFTQIRPLKRGGGRRYYRPDDIELLRGIQHLLYGDGYTIKGVQKLLREHGAKFVVAAGRRGIEQAANGGKKSAPSRDSDYTGRIEPRFDAPQSAGESPAPQMAPVQPAGFRPSAPTFARVEPHDEGAAFHANPRQPVPAPEPVPYAPAPEIAPHSPAQPDSPPVSRPLVADSAPVNEPLAASPVQPTIPEPSMAEATEPVERIAQAEARAPEPAPDVAEPAFNAVASADEADDDEADEADEAPSIAEQSKPLERERGDEVEMAFDADDELALPPAKRAALTAMLATLEALRAEYDAKRQAAKERA